MALPATEHLKCPKTPQFWIVYGQALPAKLLRDWNSFRRRLLLLVGRLRGARGFAALMACTCAGSRSLIQSQGQHAHQKASQDIIGILIHARATRSMVKQG